MDFIVGFFGGLSSLGVSVVMPIVLTIIGVLFGAWSLINLWVLTLQEL